MKSIKLQVTSEKSVWRSLRQFFVLVPVFLFFALCTLHFALPAGAAVGVNRTINFQGKIVNKTGGTNVTDGTYPFTFKIFDASTLGNQLWGGAGGESQSLPVTNGIFQAALGSVRSFATDSLDFNQDNLWLEISFNGETFGSRIRLAAVPYALTAEKVSGLTVTNNGGNTLNIAANKTLTVNNSIAFSGTDATTMTLPSTSTTLAGLSIANAFTNSQTVTASTATGNGLTVTTTGITTGAAFKIVGGTAVTTGGDMDINGAVYVHNAAETGNLAKFTFTDNSTNTTGASTTNGLDVESAFTTSGAGTKTLTGLNISAPTTASCTTGACTWNGLKVNVPAASANTTANGILLTSNTNAPGTDMMTIDNTGSTGVATGGVSGLEINYKGGTGAIEASAARVDFNPGGTSGASWNGLRLLANATGPATGVTESGLKIEPPTVSGAGTFNGVKILNATQGSGTENGVLVGAGYDNGLLIQATTALTQTAAQTGVNIDYGTNFTAASGQNLTGVSITTPTLTSSGTQTYTGLLLTPNAVTTNTGSNFTYNGLNVTTPNITLTAGLATANGEKITIGTNGVGGIQNGLLITPPATTNASSTTTGINIGSITTSSGTDTALQIGSGWDKGLSISVGTSGQGISVATTGIPATDLVDFSNAVGNEPTFSGINALHLGWNTKPATGNTSSAQRIDITNKNTATAGQAQGLRIVATGAGGAINSDTVALFIDGLASNSTGTTTENAIEIGAGWDRGVNITTSAPETGLMVSAGAAPTADMVSITNTGFGVTAAGVNGLSVTYQGGAQAVEAGAIRVDLTPGGTSGGIWNGLRFVAAATGPATGVTETGFKIQGPTTGGAGTFNGLNIANVGNTTTNGTVNGISITGTNSNSAGTEVGINIAALTAGNATERAISIGKGWDASLALGSLTANDNTAQGVIQFATSGTATTTCAIGTAQGLVFKDQAGNQIGHFCKDGSTGMEIAANSTLLNGTDVAENYSDIANTLTPGDLVSIDQNGPIKSVSLTQHPYEGLLFGIVSTEPGVLLSDVDESNGHTDLTNPKPVALTGRVPTHVSTENGPIAVGDYITSSSTPGVGMKATKPGPVVGQALQAYTGLGIGTIYVFARAGYYNGLPTQNIADGLSGDSQLAQFIGAPTDTSSISDTAVSPTGVPQITQSTLASLSVLGAATISGQLRVKSGGLFEGLLTVLDTLTTHNIVVTGVSDLLGAVVFHSGVQFSTAPSFSSDTAGFAIVHKGARSVDVVFSKTYPQTPVIQASLSLGNSSSATVSAQTTLQNNYGFIITNQSAKGFSILLNKAALDDVSFSWAALSIDKPMTAESTPLQAEQIVPATPAAVLSSQ